MRCDLPGKLYVLSNTLWNVNLDASYAQMLCELYVHIFNIVVFCMAGRKGKVDIGYDANLSYTNVNVQ